MGRSIAVNSAKGHCRARRLFSELVTETERTNHELHFEHMSNAMDYGDGWERVIAVAKRRGLPVPDPVPHPDHITIDPHNGEVTYDGPMTRQDRDAARQLVQVVLDGTDEIADMRAEAARRRSPRQREHRDRMIADETEDLARMREITGRVGWLQRDLQKAERDKRMAELNAGTTT